MRVLEGRLSFQLTHVFGLLQPRVFQWIAQPDADPAYSWMRAATSRRDLFPSARSDNLSLKEKRKSQKLHLTKENGR